MLARQSSILVTVALLVGRAPDKPVDYEYATQRGLESLHVNGSDLSLPHPMTFYLDYADEPGARAMGERLREEDYVIEYLSADEDVASHTCSATTTLVPSFEVVRGMDSLFQALAESEGGTYGGWYAPVVRD